MQPPYGGAHKDVDARKKKLEAIRAIITRDNKKRIEEVDKEMLDYAMSEKFGLNWQEYEAKRISYLISILGAIKEKEKIESRKNNINQNGGRNGQNSYRGQR